MNIPNTSYLYAYFRVLSAAAAESLFRRGQGLHNPDYMFQYWGALSACLTQLKLAYTEDVTLQMSAELNHLTQLKDLLLEGYKGKAATTHLQLPQLTELTISGFKNTRVSLDCPQLKSLKLSNLGPLQEMSGLPVGIESLELCRLAAGSVPFEQMIPEQGLKHLSALVLRDCPGSPGAVQGAYVASKLVSLELDHPWAPLLPSQPPWKDLPCNLKFMQLWHPLDDGLPLVLEQLSHLQILRVTHVGTGPMRLTRSLDPFLDMANLRHLYLCGNMRSVGEGVQFSGVEFSRWTPAALRLLGLADQRVLRMARASGGKSVVFDHEEC